MDLRDGSNTLSYTAAQCVVPRQRCRSSGTLGGGALFGSCRSAGFMVGASPTCSVETKKGPHVRRPCICRTASGRPPFSASTPPGFWQVVNGRDAGDASSTDPWQYARHRGPIPLTAAEIRRPLDGLIIRRSAPNSPPRCARSARSSTGPPGTATNHARHSHYQRRLTAELGP